VKIVAMAHKDGTLTEDEMVEIIMELALKRQARLQTPEAKAFREGVAKDLEDMAKLGIALDIPKVWPTVDPKTLGTK